MLGAFLIRRSYVASKNEPDISRFLTDEFYPTMKKFEKTLVEFKKEIFSMSIS